MKSYKTAIFVFLTLALTLLVVGCKNDRVDIGKLVQDSNAFLGKTVQIGGHVTKSYSTNLIITDLGAYQLDDGTGRVWVISHNGVPREGDTVGVKGKVDSGLKFGGEVLGVLIREEERRIQ